MCTTPIPYEIGFPFLGCGSPTGGVRFLTTVTRPPRALCPSASTSGKRTGRCSATPQGLENNSAGKYSATTLVFQKADSGPPCFFMQEMLEFWHMEVAVIKTGGKQYVVSKGDTISIEKLPGDLKKGDTVVFGEVLLVDNGSDTTIRAPLIKGAEVKGTVV